MGKFKKCMTIIAGIMLILAMVLWEKTPVYATEPNGDFNIFGKIWQRGKV